MVFGSLERVRDSLGTGTDSPVRVVSFTTSRVVLRTLTSAGTASPVASEMMSPGVRFFDSVVFHSPSRLTLARGLIYS